MIMLIAPLLLGRSVTQKQSNLDTHVTQLIPNNYSFICTEHEIAGACFRCGFSRHVPLSLRHDPQHEAVIPIAVPPSSTSISLRYIQANPSHHIHSNPALILFFYCTDTLISTRTQTTVKCVSSACSSRARMHSACQHKITLVHMLEEFK